MALSYPPFIVYQLFQLIFFLGLISACIRIDILWEQLLLDFSNDHLVLGLSCCYLFSTFCTFSA